jgi:hypothetical protein
VKLKHLQFLAIVSTALYLVPGGAHLFELPNKMAMAPADYMVVQRIYAGWQLFGIVHAVAFLSTLAHTVLVRSERAAFAYSVVAVIGLAAALAVFAMLTYPINAASEFWTVTPQPFETARRQWEYSHAVSAVLTFASLIAIVLSALSYRGVVDRRTGQAGI